MASPRQSPRGSNPMKSPRQMEGKKTWQVVTITPFTHTLSLSPWLSQTLSLSLYHRLQWGGGLEQKAAGCGASSCLLLHPMCAAGSSACPRSPVRALSFALPYPPTPPYVRRLAGD
jgi:hypothetical protein